MDKEWGVHRKPDGLSGSPTAAGTGTRPRIELARDGSVGTVSAEVPGTARRGRGLASRQTGMTRARNIPLHTASAVRITIPLADIVEHGCAIAEHPSRSGLALSILSSTPARPGCIPARANQ